MNQSQALLKIENFMHVVSSKMYDWKSFKTEYQQILEIVKSVYDDNYEYSPLIQAYFDLILQNIDLDNYVIFEKEQAFKSFQNQLREEHENFIDRLHAKNQRNRQELFKYFKGLLEQHRKLLLVRVDLSYQYERNPTIRQFDKDIKKLINRIQNKDTIFKDQVGYVYRLEQGGKSKGFHCHLLVIYNGSTRCRDGYLGQCIGELWQKQITKGDGLFFNCNQQDHKQRYWQLNKLGLGLIERKDTFAVCNAFDVISYLAQPEKDNQYLRARLKGMREFSKGQRLQCLEEYRSQKIKDIHH
ncbi:inovirus Gp2 family protein [Acinetobacter sp. ANC 3926]|uniref:YagK/YfjJ domain-containing protein n=1 Tax=Acinetobacter genomosp. 15BJ TaxID=106651 RepID=UPI001F4AF735|nr:inovirus-type Gp2 protein [Acinetobacter genomosp. 15BJ]MCH7290180.1 inovirus Gp2 family protein [Acinetobacter genomosp. 15BJ]